MTDIDIRAEVEEGMEKDDELSFESVFAQEDDNANIVGVVRGE